MTFETAATFSDTIAQNILGVALLTLGQRELGITSLEEAIVVFHTVLEGYTRERVPLHWAIAQNNVGEALLALGEREAGTARLEGAEAAFQAALEEITHERVPFLWART